MPDPFTTRVASQLPWAGDNRSGSREAEVLLTLQQLFRQGPELAVAVASLPWVVDGITEAEGPALNQIAHLAINDGFTGGRVVDFPWVVDGINDEEGRALTDLMALGATLAGEVSGFPWLQDGLTREEEKALRSLVSIVQQDDAVAETLVGFPWLGDDLTEEEWQTLVALQELLELDPTLARQLVGMPFLANDLAESDRTALDNLYLLRSDFPVQWQVLAAQGWFQDGLTDDEAVFVTVLRRHVYYDSSNPEHPADFNALVSRHFLDRREIQLPRTGPMDLYGFYLDPQVETRNFMDQMEQGVRDMEDFMGLPFPIRDLILLFAATGQSALGLNMGTHMVVTPDPQADKERFKVIVHEVGHFFWNGASSDQPQRGVPLWFQEGGANFLATYVFSRSDHPLSESLAEARDKLNQEIRWCNTQGVTRLEQLIDTVRREGYEAHRHTLQYGCNYYLGERFFLDLYALIGHQAFTTAWQEVYSLVQSLDRPVTEAEIFNAFLAAAPADRVEEFRELYHAEFGGDF